jgi:NADPH-dependent glutamate synthase beta subunit-like oxidoreductase/NAD(P)H-flavin reductase
MSELHLNHNLHFKDLYNRESLVKIDQIFVSYLKNVDISLYNKLISARVDTKLTELEYSEFIINIGPYLEDYIADLFNIKSYVNQKSIEHNDLSILYRCKRLFIQRRALKIFKGNDVLITPEFNFKDELNFAKQVMEWLENESENIENLNIAGKYAAWAVYSEEGKKLHDGGVLFKQPTKVEYANLVPLISEVIDGVTVLKSSHNRIREGFKLSDPGVSLIKALDEANYCIYCHNQNKDSCSKGMFEKSGEFKKNSLDNILTGCPLEEKISEMNLLKANGNFIASLAAAMIDNPLLAATGHRICNDCMKSCIYQKQQPVNIPKIESRVLKDVLELPWGFEIYSLLSRWNPLNIERPLPKPPTNYKILVAGLGPAGFNLSHHLLNDGHIVVAIDGLKIEPLSSNISGVDISGEHVDFKPIYDVNILYESLDNRVAAGFGGVAEYGITVRWDKNNLKLIRLLLERRTSFAMYGGVRFGSTITYDNAFASGFNHIALALGAGKPNLIEMENPLVKGVRTASDFLMGLQLSGAALGCSIANLQIRLPIVVIGGGLTAIDTATEALSYYIVQVEKFLKRYEILSNKLGTQQVRKSWNEEDAIIADEFISHATSLRTASDKLSLINQWGGVRVLYRKNLADAPSYRLNHEEVELAMQEGIGFVENATPIALITNKFKAVEAIKLEDGNLIKAHTVLIAAGTSPNTVIAREDNEHFKLDGKYFKAIDENLRAVIPEKNAKPKDVAILTSIDNNKSVSFFGDLHPSFAGNVVKAMASAKRGYPIISKILGNHPPIINDNFFAELNKELIATIYQINRLTDNIIEIIVKAPLAAKEFKPGQFYRLQNFASISNALPMEALALTGASIDEELGLISLITLEMGGSSNLCAKLSIGERVTLMGPTGTPTEIHGNENVMLIGGGLGNAVLFSIGKAFKSAGSKVLYFAGYKQASDRYKIHEIEQAADQIIWCCDEELLSITREQDSSFHGNIIEAIENYSKNLQNIKLCEINRIIAIGSDKMMQAVNIARMGKLKSALNPNHTAIASINSPMQCMMKEICAQCLQKHIDPLTGLKTYVYSCFNQDQNMELVDFEYLNQRLSQNSLQEKLTKLWLEFIETK